MASVIPFMAVYIMTLISVTLQIEGLSKGEQSTVDQGKSMHVWANSLHWIASFVDPFYCLPGAFAAIGLTILSDMPMPPGIDLDLQFPTLFGSPVAVPILGSIFLSSVLALLTAWDTDRFCGAIMHRLRSMRQGQVNDQDIEMPASHSTRLSFVEDMDVIAQERSLADTDPSSKAVLYKGLVHTYNKGSSREVRAVRGISLGVSRGECFTLLGPNGAGKTTTLDVLTGAIYPPTEGEVSINGSSVTGSKGDRQMALRNLGNCPQVDPLWPTLTGRQHLMFYGKIKGLPPHVLTDQTNMLLKAMGFSDFDANKPTQAYSGGMKRKLSLAIALIGSPPTLLLDEPSAAVDAAAKRHLWRVVKQREAEQTVVLTTHSMEEAEALSDRLAIQVKGRLRCVGTPDHIKNTHGAGYQLEMYVSRPERSLTGAGRQSNGSFLQASTSIGPSSDVKQYVQGICKEANLLEYHEGRYLFQLPVLKAVGAREGELSLATLFLRMHEANSAIGLRDYSIARPTLEQVFLRFSKEQDELTGGFG
jgi:ABC-type multidrug transport system ATPase subunit